MCDCKCGSFGCCDCLLAEVVYGRSFDSSLRAGLKSQRTVAELLESAQPLKEAIEEFRKASVSEQTGTENASEETTDAKP
eukprot:15359773-Alexandrium_andersonii.AAC.1